MLQVIHALHLFVNIALIKKTEQVLKINLKEKSK